MVAVDAEARNADVKVRVFVVDVAKPVSPHATKGKNGVRSELIA